MSVIANYLARQRTTCSALLIALFTLLGAPAFADVYRWVDEAGEVHYSDTAPRGIEAEPMQIQPTDPAKGADEGELRRRRLLEEADRKAEQRLRSQRARTAAQQAEREKALERKKECLEARKALAVLQEQLPVYRNSDGKLHNKWALDSYQGEREYLNETARAAEIARVRQRISTLCEQPDDTEKQDFAREQMIRDQYCAAHKAELEELQRPEARASRWEIEEKQKQVDSYCKEPSEEDLELELYAPLRR